MSIVSLGVGKDKTGAEVEIKHTSAIGFTPVLPFFMKQFVALIEKGWAHYSLTANNDSRAIYAEIDGRVVGNIVYKILDDQTKTAWIILSAVDDDYRQRGIYNLMYRQFEPMVKKLGCKKIASHVHVDNKPRQASCASTGLKPFHYRMEKDL
jgi:GNAT superfamily N-acetyltransferase